MTSNPSVTEAFVWVWLPNALTPVIAGKLTKHDERYFFSYGQSYLKRDDAIALYVPELPLMPGTLPIPEGLTMPSCIRDASPDAWGRKIIEKRMLKAGVKDQIVQSNEITYLLESGSDRIGALDFGTSSTSYQPRTAPQASLDELHRAVELTAQGLPVPDALYHALNHGTSIGGARPKALLDAENKKYIAKFALSSDGYNIIKAEFVAMRLALACGLCAAPVKLTEANGKDVLLIERFDREGAEGGFHRKAIVSALTLLGLDEMMARYASYQTFADIIRHRFTEPKATLRELFARISFNILCGNTDDHARNHAAFWDGHALSLTPAYDICPQNRVGGEATQAMLIEGDMRLSRLNVLLNAAPNFLLREDEALALVRKQITTIGEYWEDVCTEADLGPDDRRMLVTGQFLNPYAFEQLSDDREVLAALAQSVRGTLVG